MDTSRTDHQVRLDSLPNEILVHICSFLDARFVLDVVSRISPRLRDLIADDSLWKIRAKRRMNSQFPPIDPTSELKWHNICTEQEEFFARPADPGIIKKAQVKGHYASVDALLLVPLKGDDNRELLVSGSRDRSVGVWDPKAMLNDVSSPSTTDSKTRGLVQKLDVHKGWVWSLSHNNEGKVVSCGWDNMIYGWSFRESGEMTQDLSINCKTAVLCSTYVGDTVSVGSFDRKVKTFDVRAPNTRPVHTHTHHKMPVLSVLTPRNHPNLLLTASEDGSLTSIDQRTRKVTARLAFPAAYPMCMAVVDGDNCLYVGDKAGGLHLVDCTGGKLIKVKTVEGLHSDKVVGIDASHAGVVTCSTDKTVRLLHPDLEMTAHRTFDVRDHGEVTSVSYSALTGTLAMGHSQEVIQVYSAKEIKGGN